jgi:hypothetical protein
MAGAAVALIERLAEADRIYREACDRLIESWRMEPCPPDRWSKLIKGWQHLPARTRLQPPVVKRTRDKLTLADVRWKQIEGEDADGNEIGIATCARWIEIAPSKPLHDRGPLLSAKFSLGSLKQRYEAWRTDDDAIRRDVLCAHLCRWDPKAGRGAFRVATPSGYWWGMPGSEGELFLIGFIAGPAEIVLDRWTNRPCIQWRTQ